MMAIILEKRYRIKRKKMKDEKYVNSGIATLDAANITFDDFEMPFPLQKWISKLFLILCSIKTGQITLYRAGEYFLS